MSNPRAGASKSNAAAIERADTTAAMLKLKLEGHSLDAIGERFGITGSGVAHRIRRALDSAVKEPAGQLIELEARRLDDTLANLIADRDAIGPGASLQAASVRARIADTIVKVSERRSRLLGLDRGDVRADAEAAARLLDRQTADQVVGLLDEVIDRLGLDGETRTRAKALLVELAEKRTDPDDVIVGETE
ncbi:hypothetical protein [Sinomonas albida]|uniref:hypothetical protein n=1 Tax=Sinomonas albida TaxID=369942 RepID=UPI003016CD24